MKLLKKQSIKLSCFILIVLLNSCITDNSLLTYKDFPELYILENYNKNHLDLFIKSRDFLFSNDNWQKVNNKYSLNKFALRDDKEELSLLFLSLEKEINFINQFYKTNNTVHRLYNFSLEGRLKQIASFEDSIVVYEKLKLLDEISYILGKSSFYKTQARELKDKINKWMWNEADTFYYDIDALGLYIKKHTCFIKVLDLELLDSYQEEKILKNLFTEENFNFYGFENDKAYTNDDIYYFLNYLNKNSYNNIAYNFSLDFLDFVSKNKQSLNCSPDLAMLIYTVFFENIIGIKKDPLNRLVKLNLYCSNNIKIHNLNFAKILDVALGEKEIIINIDTNKQFYLDIYFDGKSKTFNILPFQKSYIIKR